MELKRQLESGVNGSRQEERDSSLFMMRDKISHALPAVDFSFKGDSDVGAGVEGSVFSGPRIGGEVFEGSETGPSPRPMLIRCCSSMIFFRYSPWASILSWSCLWTCHCDGEFRRNE